MITAEILQKQFVTAHFIDNERTKIEVLTLESVNSDNHGAKSYSKFVILTHCMKTPGTKYKVIKMLLNKVCYELPKNKD